MMQTIGPSGRRPVLTLPRHGSRPGRAGLWASLVVLAVAAPPRTTLAEDPADAGAAPAAEQSPPDTGAQDVARARAKARQAKFDKRVRLVPHYEYLEDSYLNSFLPLEGPAGDQPLAFEAQAATHLFLVNQWDRVERITPPGTMASVWSWDISFLLKLRMVQDKSAPVRPPSYMPGTHVQWFGLWKRGAIVHELETQFGLTHHSNGQQQCSFVTDQSTPDPGERDACLTVQDALGNGRPLRDQVNYRSGDFSTSYGTIGMHYAYMNLDGDRYAASRSSLGVVYEHNFVLRQSPFGEFPGAISSDKARLYGIHRVKFEAATRWHLGQPDGDLGGVLSASISHELMWNTGPSIPNNRSIAELSYTINGFHGAGLFVRGFTGQDYMNILYAAGRTSMVQFGIIWNTSPAVRYLFGEGPIPGE